MNMLYSNLGRLRIVGFLEGLSYLFLVFIAMPLKYYGDMPEATQEIGMAHGVLFVLYVGSIIPVMLEFKWSVKTTLLVFLASLFPFGTFIAEFKIFREEAEEA